MNSFKSQNEREVEKRSSARNATPNNHSMYDLRERYGWALLAVW